MKKFFVVLVATSAVLSLGLAQIHCGSSGNEYDCISEADCDTGYYCDLTVHECKLQECTPVCAGKCCGPNTCDGECPESCPVAGTYCNRTTCACEDTCQPDCAGKECGPDGCGNDCGQGCSAGYDCIDGACVCEPVCLGRICGPDPDIGKFITFGEESVNVAITSLDVYQDMFKEYTEREAYVTIENYSNDGKAVRLTVFLNDEIIMEEF